MADTSTFMPVGELPMIDYGAVYRNAKARRELEEEKKLAYLNQFQQERGAFTPGMQSELQAEWDAIEADLDNGDMSFEAKARRQKLYAQYQQHAADALQYSNTINDMEASILSNVGAYNDPQGLLEDLQNARLAEVSLQNIPLAVQELPDLKQSLRFVLPEVSPNAMAGAILQNMKSTQGYRDFYDMAKTGNLQPEEVARKVTAFLDVNAMSQEEEDKAIAYVLHQMGALSNTVSDVTQVRNLNEEQREQYLGEYAKYVIASLTNLLAQDITTEYEKEQREIRIAKRKARIQREASAASTPSYTVLVDNVKIPGALPMDPTSSELPQMDQEPGPVAAGTYAHIQLPIGTRPTYEDYNTNTKYTLHEIGISNGDAMVDEAMNTLSDAIPAGTPVAIISRDQKYADATGDTRTRKAYEVIPFEDLPLDLLSNTKSAAIIKQAYNQLLPYSPYAQAEYNKNTPTVNPGPSLDESRAALEEWASGN
jgi:hypothetical protein